ncbi:efflux RND transporter periplasmic adaptor subunit [Rhodoflexus sp.]
MRKICFFLLLACIAAACADKQATVSEVPARGEVIPVRLASATVREVAEPVAAAGLVASETEARMSFKTGGIIRKIYVEEGQSVQAGQLLASLDLTEINAQALQATENLAKAERDLQRITRLYSDSVATLEQLQNATTAYNIAQQQLAVVRFNQSYSEIRATASGKIIRKLMNEGEFAGPGTPVLFFQAVGNQNQLIRVGVADKDWVRLRLGDPAVVRFDAYPGREWRAKVSNLAQAADPMNSLYQIEIKLTDTDLPALVAGFFASVTITPSQSSSLVAVPIDAIIEGRGSEAFVFVPEDGKARKIPVKIAFLRNKEAYLSSGLQGGEQVITAGSAYLTENVRISVMP